jgi:uncharacterized protein
MKQRWKRQHFLPPMFIFTVGLVLSLALVSFSIPTDPTTLAQTASSYPKNQALYVTAQDGTNIAIDVWLPDNLPQGTKIPTLMKTTPYWRGVDLVDKGQQTNPDTADANGMPYYSGYVNHFNQAGYAVVLVDARGIGASFSNYVPSPSRNNIQDYNAVVNWIIAQPWSNQKVGAYGTSADANTTEFLAVTHNPAVKAIVPRAMDFDFYTQLIFPGGLLSDTNTKGLFAAIQFLQRNANFCGLPRQERRPDCQQYIQATGNKGVKPVDADSDKRLLTAAVLQHTQNTDWYKAAQGTAYRDDPLGNTGTSSEDYSLFNFKDAIERSNVAIYTWASWLDAGTAKGALNHFMTFSNPQKTVIGPWTHGAYATANPFLPPDTPVSPTIQEQLQDMTQFFDTYLKDTDDESQALNREVTYYTLGEEKWKTTEIWPPSGITNQSWYLTANGGLQTTAPTAQTGADNYTINFEATTGSANRWFQGYEPGKIMYPDRATEDQKLLTYTSTPLPEDTEVTGSPIITLHVSSTASDGAFIVYLEDIDPSGKVTYISEGELRPIHRKVSTDAAPYRVLGPYHSFKRQDGLPFVPGEVTELAFDLEPTSALFKQGHQIRVAIAGHDKGTFNRYPAEGTPVISVERNQIYPSHIDLPVMTNGR